MTIVAPALRGDDALGFLASVGIVALSEQGEIPPVRLAWRGRSAPVAAFEGPETIEDLARSLNAALLARDERDELVPGTGPDFPPSNRGSTKDRMRMPPGDMASLYREADRRWVDQGDPWLARWLSAIAAQASHDKDGRVELTPFYAPTGRMTLRGSLLEEPMKESRSVDGPGDALVGWKRTSSYGANFDERAVRDGAISTNGKSDNRGAPSPTWLAVMAMRMFPLVDDGSSVSAVGWQQFRLYTGYTRRSLVWPTWMISLDAPAIRALLAHPLLELTGAPDDPSIPVSRSSKLAALGVSGVFGASRRTTSQGDGPLGPARRLWPGSEGRDSTT